MQSSVSNAPLRAFEGMVHDAPERQISALASELVYFGKAVSYAKDASLDAFPPLVQMYTSGQVLAGIAAASSTVERLANPTTGVSNQAPYGAYKAETTIDRLIRKGRVWVKSADAVDDFTKSVFIRNAADSGTAASITDTTTYAVADQDTKTLEVTITDADGATVQTATFSGSTTTAAGVAAQLNDQLVGVSVAVVGGQVVITTDEVGEDMEIAITGGTSALTWDTPVDGTGAVADIPDNSRGSFRATTASGYTEFGAGTGLKWIRSATIGGDYYGLLEINLP